MVVSTAAMGRGVVSRAVVAVQVCEGKPMPLAIFEPLLGRAVATDSEGPSCRIYTVKALFGIGPPLAEVVIL